MKKRIPIKGFSERLEKLIFESDMSLNDICRKAEISRTRLWGYRFNGDIPCAGSLVGLCKALNVSADYLIGLSKEECHESR